MKSSNMLFDFPGQRTTRPRACGSQLTQSFPKRITCACKTRLSALTLLQ